LPSVAAAQAASSARIDAPKTSRSAHSSIDSQTDIKQAVPCKQAEIGRGWRSWGIARGDGRHLQAEREEVCAAWEALEQQVLAERTQADEEWDARIQELEELACVRVCVMSWITRNSSVKGNAT
jgi:hypothetical protein